MAFSFLLEFDWISVESFPKLNFKALTDSSSGFSFYFICNICFLFPIILLNLLDCKLILPMVEEFLPNFSFLYYLYLNVKVLIAFSSALNFNVFSAKEFLTNLFCCAKLFKSFSIYDYKFNSKALLNSLFVIFSNSSISFGLATCFNFIDP